LMLAKVCNPVNRRLDLPSHEDRCLEL
jgi:hypothetical protein